MKSVKAGMESYKTYIKRIWSIFRFLSYVFLLVHIYSGTGSFIRGNASVTVGEEQKSKHP
jgi:hypothetical protein